MVAQRGFDPSLLKRFEKLWTSIESGAQRAVNFASAGRIVVPDVNEDESYKPLRTFAAEAGYRAVHSIPLFDRNDQPLGVLTTHFRQPHKPSERELRLTDLYARQFADVIAFKSCRAERARVRRSIPRDGGADDAGRPSMRLFGPNAVRQSALMRNCRPFSAEQLHQLRLQEITHPDDLCCESERSFARLARDGTPFQMEQRLIRGDGEPGVGIAKRLRFARSGRTAANRRRQWCSI